MHLLVFIFLTLFTNKAISECTIQNCLSCNTENDNSNNICISCLEGYTLTENNLCRSSLCQDNQYEQIYISQSSQQTLKRCVLICNQNEVANQLTNTCDEAYECTNTFKQSSSTNKSRSIRFVFYSSNEKLIYLVYDSFVNAVSSSNGSFKRTFLFDNGVSSLNVIDNQLFLLNIAEKQILKWDPYISSSKLLSQITKGELKPESQIFKFFNVQRYVASTFDNKNKLILLSEIDENSPQAVSFTYVNQQSAADILYTFKNFIMIQKNDDYNILIIYVFEDQITKQPKTRNMYYECSVTQANIIDSIGMNYKEIKLFFVIFKDVKEINMQVEINDQINCFKIQTNLFPVSINLLEIDHCNDSNYQLFLTVNFEKQLIKQYLVKENGLEEYFELPQKQVIVDFNIIKQNNNLQISTILFGNIIQIYTVNDLSCSSKNTGIEINLVKTFNLYLSNPIKFYALSEQNNQIQQNILTSQQTQVLLPTLDQPLFLQRDFFDKVFQNEISIAKTLILDYYKFIVSCSIDGKIIIWKAVDTFSPKYLYSISKKGQVCKNLQGFKDNWVIVLLSSEIFIFNVLNITQMKSYPILTQSTSQIKVTNDYIYLFYDDSAFVLSQYDTIIAVSQKQNFPNQFLNLAQIFVPLSNKIITYSLLNEIKIYDIDYVAGVINGNPTYSYTNPVKVVVIKLFNQIGGFHIVLYDYYGLVRIFNNTLNYLNMFQITIGYAYLINTFDKYYIFSIKLMDTTKINQYTLLFLDMTTGAKTYVGQFFIIYEFVTFRWMKNNLGQDAIVGINWIPVYFTSFTCEFYWVPNSSRSDVPFGHFTYSPQQTMLNAISDKSNTFILSGNTSGDVRVTPIVKEYNDIQVIFQTTNPQENINFIYVSPLIEVQFIFTYQIYCYSIHTDTLIETINFTQQQTNTFSNILNFQVSERRKLLISFISTELIIRDFKNNSFISYKCSQDTQLKFINGFFYDENTDELFIYGNVFIKISSKLENQVIISEQDQSFQNFIICLIDEIIACRADADKIAFYNRSQFYYNEITTLTTSEKNCKIVVDNQNKYILIFNRTIQVYSYTGTLILSITTFTSDLLSIKYYDTFFIVLTASISYTYDSKSFKQLGLFNSPGGNILGTIFVKEFNWIGYYCEELRSGQIIFYSSETFLPSGFSINTYDQVGIGEIIKPIYDVDNGMINYVDEFGNVQSLYLSKKTLDNTFSIEEITQQQTQKPRDMVQDFITNIFLIHNGVKVWKMNQALLTRQSRKLFNRPTNHYFIINPSSETDKKFLISDYLNTIFLYKNQEITFFGQYNEDILDMRQINQFEKFYFIIFFKQKILAFKSYNDISSPENSSIVLDKYLYKQIILNESNKIILNTIDNQIIDYDFFNNKLIFSIQLDLVDEIITTLVIGSQPTSNWVLFYGTYSGKIGQYDLIKNTHITKTIQAKIPIIQIRQINENTLLAIDSKGGAIMIDIYTLETQSEQPIINSIKEQLIKENIQQINQQIQIFQVDLQYMRYYVNFFAEKKLAIFSLKDNKFLQYLLFPDDQWKQIYLTGELMLISCSFQINIYNQQDFSFINYIRRYNRKDIITDLRIIDKNKIITVFNSRIEILLIIKEQNKIQLIDSFDLNDPKLIYASIQNNNQQLILVGTSKESIFEKRLSLSLIYQAQNINQNNKIQNKQYCFSELHYDNQAEIQNQFDQVYNPYTANIMYIFQTKIHNEIRNFDAINKVNSQIILRPTDINNNYLNIKKDSFITINFNLYLEGFDLKFIDNLQAIKTNSQTQKIVFQNITIQNQELSTKTNFLFENKQSVNLQNVLFANLTISRKNDGQGNSTSNYDQTSSFLTILSCQKVYIENLTLQNVTFVDTYFAYLIQVIKVDSIIIKNLIITDCSFKSMIKITQSVNVVFESLQIFNSNKNSKEFVSGNYAIEFVGVNYLTLSNLIIKDNYNTQIFSTMKKFILDGNIMSLTQDIIVINDVLVQDNKIQTQNSNLDSLNLLSLETSFIEIYRMKYFKNSGNILATEATNIKIEDCEFQLNIGIKGGAIQVENLSNNFFIKNSIFSNNQAKASGGAIYLKEANYLEIDSSSAITGNKALIGGGIRIINNDQILQTMYQISCNMNNNKADIYGSNIGYYLTRIEIYVYDINEINQSSTSQQNLNLLYSGFIQKKDNIISINSAKSGGDSPAFIKLLDDDLQQLKLDENMFLNHDYHFSIIDELNSFYLEFLKSNLSHIDNNNLELKGETLISIKQFDYSHQMFSFTTLSVSSIPNSQNKHIQLKISFRFINYDQFIDLKISFRPCILGEVLYYQKKSSSSTSTTSVSNLQDNNIIICQYCSFGTYSLIDPMLELQSNIFTDSTNSAASPNFQTCKKCPSQASYCEGSKIILNIGYWRENKLSDEIIKCNEISPFICNEEDPDNISGCIEGYKGPLCETCDSTGETWNGKRFSQQISDYKCYRCSENSYQIIFFVTSVICLYLYLFLSTYFFMNRYIYHSTCYYLRLLNILPFSKSCTLDESSYFVKILINYLQISTLMYTKNINIAPYFLTVIPDTSGKPASQIVISTTCLFGIGDLQLYGLERLRAYGISFFPLILSIILFIQLFIFRKLNIMKISTFHKYTMIPVVFLFFQPDCIGFFTKALSCRTIGNKSFLQINNLIDCSDNSYHQFSLIFILPNLIFWSITPIFIYLSLKKHGGHNQEKLNYCTTKFRFGYFYLEFKKNYYYWEFIRIYLKILLVLITILLNDANINLTPLYLIVMFVYILIIMSKQPFESQNLHEVEIASFVIIIKCSLFFYLYQMLQMNIFQFITVLLHYGFLSYVFLIIIKLKFISQSNSLSRLLKTVFKKLCPVFLINIFLKENYNNTRALRYWRKIYKNSKIVVAQSKLTQYNKLVLNTQEFQSVITGIDMLKKNRNDSCYSHDSPAPQMSKKNANILDSFFNSENILNLDSVQNDLQDMKAKKKFSSSIFNLNKNTVKQNTIDIQEQQNMSQNLNHNSFNNSRLLRVLTACPQQTETSPFQNNHLFAPNDDDSISNQVYQFSQLIQSKANNQLRKTFDQ